jgi:hypothetical protein
MTGGKHGSMMDRKYNSSKGDVEGDDPQDCFPWPQYTQSCSPQIIYHLLAYFWFISLGG